MKNILIVGLGNPGFSNTYHNVGSDLLLKWIKTISDIKKISENLYCYKKDEILIFILIEPSLMNISGVKISKIYKYYKCSNLIVVVDDLDTNIDIVRYKPGIAANGHNGIRSIITELTNINFYKILIGIGRPDNNMSVSNFVLSKRTDIYNDLLYKNNFEQFIIIISKLLLEII